MSILGSAGCEFTPIMMTSISKPNNHTSQPNRLLKNIYERHAPVLLTMARGAYELRQKYPQGSSEFYDLEGAWRCVGFLWRLMVGVLGVMGAGGLTRAHTPRHNSAQLPGRLLPEPHRDTHAHRAVPRAAGAAQARPHRPRLPGAWRGLFASMYTRARQA